MAQWAVVAGRHDEDGGDLGGSRAAPYVPLTICMMFCTSGEAPDRRSVDQEPGYEDLLSGQARSACEMRAEPREGVGPCSLCRLGCVTLRVRVIVERVRRVGVHLHTARRACIL